MNIVEFRVKGLFGIFDHCIPLTNPEKVTVIHGPNGIGKTMLLRLIKGFSDQQLSVFGEIPFIEFSVKRSDGAILKLNSDRYTTPVPKEDFHIHVTAFNPEGLKLKDYNRTIRPIVPKEVLDALDMHVPITFSRQGAGWKKAGGSRTHSLQEIIEAFPKVSDYLPDSHRTDIFRKFSGELNVFYVDTVRLSAEPSKVIDTALFETSNETEETLRVKQHSKDISEKIKKSITSYARKSQELDRTFPDRLVKFLRKNSSPLDSKNIILEISKIENRRNRLHSLGLLESEQGLEGVSEKDVERCAEALTIYIEDMKSKLSVFDTIVDQTGRLMDIINHRFKYKQLSLSRDDGFTFKSLTGDDIKISDLSSGEQHELILLYELIFRTPNNSLILIDEPEISLHVAWQTSFINDLMSILEPSNSYGVVATHSPTLIGPHWDLAVELTGPELIKREK